MIEGLKASPVINGFTAAKKLKVLSIYPDEELDEWKSTATTLRKNGPTDMIKNWSIKNKTCMT